jgi:hypothetical protein
VVVVGAAVVVGAVVVLGTVDVDVAGGGTILVIVFVLDPPQDASPVKTTTAGSNPILTLRDHMAEGLAPARRAHQPRAQITEAPIMIGSVGGILPQLSA